MKKSSICLTSFPGDVREQLYAASAYCRSNPGTTLVIPAGRYVLRDARAAEIREEVLSGRYGENPEAMMFRPDFPFSIGLDLRGCRDITVEAYGAVLLIDGFMEPIGVRSCTGVTIRGLTIDHVRRPYSEGLIETVDSAGMTVRFREPVSASAPVPRAYVYHPRKGRLDYIGLDVGERYALDAYTLRFCRAALPAELKGCTLYCIHTFHFRPGILISHSQNTRLRDVTIHSQPGMGIVGYKSRDICIKRLRVVPAEGSYISTNTDATHFACCSGMIRIENSEFAGHGDDAVNIHSYYYTPVRQPDDPLDCCTLENRAPTGTHAQEPDIPCVGSRLRLVRKSSLEEADSALYTVIAAGSASPTRVQLDRPLPADCSSFLFANMSELPALLFRNNHVRNHLARCVLIKTHNALVENCLFENSSGTAIHVAAESWWYEGVAAENVTIRGNTFLHCGFSGHGRILDASAIAVNISADDPSAVGVQRNIRILDNRIVGGDCAPVAIQIHNTRRAEVLRNTFEGFSRRLEQAFSEDIRTDF